MSSRDVIENKISFIERGITEARKSYHAKSLDDFSADRILRGSLERDLYVIAQATIDLAEAIVAYKRLRKPTTMRDAFDIIAENDIIPSDFLASFHKIVGFRNILAYGYTVTRMCALRFCMMFSKASLPRLRNFWVTRSAPLLCSIQLSRSATAFELSERQEYNYGNHSGHQLWGYSIRFGAVE